MKICFIDIVSIVSFILLSNNLLAQAMEPILQWEKLLADQNLTDHGTTVNYNLNRTDKLVELMEENKNFYEELLRV